MVVRFSSNRKSPIDLSVIAWKDNGGVESKVKEEDQTWAAPKPALLEAGVACHRQILWGVELYGAIELSWSKHFVLSSP